MNLSFVRGLNIYRRGSAPLLISLAVVSCGCGSSERTSTSAGEGSSKVLKAEDYYRYEGEGKDRKKVALSRQEKNKLRHDAVNKSESQ
jgi:hypothetical protein